MLGRGAGARPGHRRAEEWNRGAGIAVRPHRDQRKVEGELRRGFDLRYRRERLRSLSRDREAPST